MALWASVRSAPVVSAMIWAIRGMQAVEPSTPGNSSGVRKGSAGAALDAESSELAEEEAGLLHPASRAAAVPRPRAVRKLRREIEAVRNIKMPP